MRLQDARRAVNRARKMAAVQKLTLEQLTRRAAEGDRAAKEMLENDPETRIALRRKVYADAARKRSATWHAKKAKRRQDAAQ